jgi:hypothetical protein
MPERMLPDYPQQTTLSVRVTKDASFGVGAAGKERNVWKTKAASLDKHLTEADAALQCVKKKVLTCIPALRSSLLSEAES